MDYPTPQGQISYSVEETAEKLGVSVEGLMRAARDNVLLVSTFPRDDRPRFFRSIVDRWAIHPAFAQR